MALPLANGIIEVGLHWQVGEDASAITRLHFQGAGSPYAQADLNTMATAVRTAFGTQLKALMSGYNTLLQTTCADLGSNAGLQGLDGTQVPGTRAGSSGIAQLCALINHKIARKYRGGKPRSYLPFGLGGDLQDPQTWNTTFSGNLQTGWTAFLAAITGGTFGAITGLKHCSVSYYQPGGQWNVVNNRPKYTPHVRTTPVIDLVVASTVNPKPATQRRRTGR